MFDQTVKLLRELASSIRSMRENICFLLGAVDCTDTQEILQAPSRTEVRGSLAREDARQRWLVSKPKKPPSRLARRSQNRIRQCEKRTRYNAKSSLIFPRFKAHKKATCAERAHM